MPFEQSSKKWSDRKKYVLEPLFKSYVFVRVPETDHSMLKKIHGVVNMVYWIGKPAVVKDVEIELIKRFMSECNNIKLEKRPIYVNDKVRVVNGPLMEMEGHVIGLKTRSVKIVIPSLGYLMHAEIETADLRVIHSIKDSENQVTISEDTAIYAYN